MTLTPQASLKQRISFTLSVKLGWLLILALGHLARITVSGRRHFESACQNKNGFIYCIWHGKILLPIFAHRCQNIHAMVSQHRDGEMIAQTLHRLGYRTIRGSSTRGGTQALREMVKVLRAGLPCAIMPDGPKGPRHQFKAGALHIAQISGASLLPMTFSARRRIVVKSWDRFNIVLPLSRARVFYGEPINVPRRLRGEDMEALRQEVEQSMLALEQQAEAHFAS